MAPTRVSPTIALLTSVLALLTLSTSLAAAPAPWRVLPWVGGPLQPGITAPAPEQERHAPCGIALAKGKIVLGDRVHQRILVLDNEARPTASFPIGKRGLLGLTTSGARVAWLDASQKRLWWLDISRADAKPRRIPLKTPATAVLTGHKGRLWVLDSLDNARLASGRTRMARARPLGAGVPWHGAGLKTGEKKGEALLWRWQRAARVKPPGPDWLIEVRTRRRLGMIEPLAVTAGEDAYLRIETLSEGSPLHVWEAVHRVPMRGARSKVIWPVNGIAATPQNITVSSDGTIYRMAARPNGLWLWRIRLDRGPGGGR